MRVLAEYRERGTGISSMDSMKLTLCPGQKIKRIKPGINTHNLQRASHLHVKHNHFEHNETEVSIKYHVPN